MISALLRHSIERNKTSKLALDLASAKYFRVKQDNNMMVYSYIVSKYLKKDKFDFGKFFLPYISEDYYTTMAIEFLDLIAPYIPEDQPLLPFATEGTYENFGVAVEARDIVIDAGANFGIFSAFASSKKAKVYAFEPVPSTRAYLEKTIQLNTGDITVVPLALSEKAGQISIFIQPDNIGAASIVAGNENNSLEIETVSLDGWAEQNKIDRIDFIKADH